MLWVLIVFAVALCALYGLQQLIGFAHGAEVLAPGIEQVHIPTELWYVIAGGIVQGLIWYGAVNAKVTALAERMTQIERRADRDRQEQSEKFAQLLSVFVDNLHERKRQ